MRTESENRELANLLYPNITKTVEDYYKMYPARNLPEGAEVTRVAPSPTGYFHIGGLYQSILDRTLAKKTNGVFFLRIEDTDTKREVKDAGEIAYDMLCTFGLSPDEGYQGENAEQGMYGPYKQSDRIEIYKAFAKRLVELGRAFPCFCKKSESKEDVLKRREEELEESNDIGGHDACRDMPLDEIKEHIVKGDAWALRLYSLGDAEKTFKFKDRIKGERELRENDKDIVLMKSDGIPPYSLAHLVDDTLMHTTTVVRGEEWFASLPAHLELFRAFGLKPPKYAHTPVICKLDNGNKRKLSKRKDLEADSRYFIRQGYPIGGVIEYLINLLNSDFEQWRVQNPTLHYEQFPFSINKIGSNSPMFDFVKLADVCKNYISRLIAETVFIETTKWANEEDLEFGKMLNINKSYAVKVLNIDREKPRPRKDIAKWSDVPELFFYMFNDIFWSRIRGYEFPENIAKEDIKEVLVRYMETYSQAKDNQEWFEHLKSVADKTGFASDMKAYKQIPSAYKGSVADISTIIRVAITTRANSPDLFEIMTLLGVEEINKRILFLIKK